jgi:Hypervirulence associated proteins TUDOR domain
MAKQLKTGDRVAWQSSRGGSVGRVERDLMSPGTIKGHEVAASHDNRNISCAPRSQERSPLTNLPV